MMNLTNVPPVAQSITLLLVVVIIKSIVGKFSAPSKSHFFNFYCQRLADKVNKAENSAQQQTIAGFIAMLITLAPVIIILWLFAEFIAVPMLWQAVLLYLALGGFNLPAQAKKVAQAIVANDKYQAKQLLSPWLLRDTEQMSALGLNKACIETLLLRNLQLHFIVGFYFLLFGPLAALAFRLLLEMHYSWNIKQHRFHSFGKIVNQIVNILQWLPSRLFLFLQIIISVNQSTLLYWRLIKPLFFRLNNSISLSYLAYHLGIKLGGVAMYQKCKVRRASFNEQGQQPQPQDIIHTIKHIRKINFLTFALLSTLTILLSAAYV